MIASPRRATKRYLNLSKVAWTHRSTAGRILPMPRLTDYELETAARACRAFAHKVQQGAQQISDPALRGPVAKRAECAAALAERFEKARQMEQVERSAEKNQKQ